MFITYWVDFFSKNFTPDSLTQQATFISGELNTYTRIIGRGMRSCGIFKIIIQYESRNR